MSKTWFNVKISHEVTVRAKNAEEAEKLAFEGITESLMRPTGKKAAHFYIDITKATKDQIRPYEE